MRLLVFLHFNASPFPRGEALEARGMYIILACLHVL
jgi:hypothetical protein